MTSVTSTTCVVRSRNSCCYFLYVYNCCYKIENIQTRLILRYFWRVGPLNHLALSIRWIIFYQMYPDAVNLCCSDFSVKEAKKTDVSMATLRLGRPQRKKMNTKDKKVRPFSLEVWAPICPQTTPVVNPSCEIRCVWISLKVKSSIGKPSRMSEGNSCETNTEQYWTRSCSHNW